MKRIVLVIAVVCLYHFTAQAQKKYAMVIEKTDGSEIVVNTEDIIRTFFKVISNNEDPGNNDNSGGSSELYSHLINKYGQRVLLTGYGSTIFTYDNEGRWIGYGDYKEPLEYKVKGLTVKRDDSSRYDEYQLILNSDGLISEMTHILKEYKSNGVLGDDVLYKYKLIYNEKKQLIEINVDFSSVSHNSSGLLSGSETGTSKTLYTWENDNLVMQNGIGEETITQSDNTSYIMNITNTQFLKYGSQANPTKQMPYKLMRLGKDEFFGMFGLKGVGPAYLPTEITTETISYNQNTGKTDTRTDTHTYTFTLNDDGTIASEQEDDKYPSLYQYGGTIVTKCNLRDRF